MQSVSRRRIPPATFLVIAIGMIARSSSSLLASSVVPMNVATLADHAGQVIIGEVESIQSYWADNPRRIASDVYFKRVEYLKGRQPNSSDTFKLTVPGGRVGSMQMRISCAPEFEIGGRYLLFLLPTYKTFPTVGMEQGAFRIVRDAAGADRVYAANGYSAVQGFSTDCFVRLTAKSPEQKAQLIHATHARVRQQPAAQTNSEAISLDDFSAQLRPILEKSKDHSLAEPAGRPVHVQQVPVPLKRAGGSEPADSSLKSPASESSASNPALRGAAQARESNSPTSTNRVLKAGGAK